MKVIKFLSKKVYSYSLTLLHSKWPKLWSFGCFECNRVNAALLQAYQHIHIRQRIRCRLGLYLFSPERTNIGLSDVQFFDSDVKILSRNF